MLLLSSPWGPRPPKTQSCCSSTFRQLEWPHSIKLGIFVSKQLRARGSMLPNQSSWWVKELWPPNNKNIGSPFWSKKPWAWALGLLLGQRRSALLFSWLRGGCNRSHRADAPRAEIFRSLCVNATPGAEIKRGRQECGLTCKSLHHSLLQWQSTTGRKIAIMERCLRLCLQLSEIQWYDRNPNRLSTCARKVLPRLGMKRGNIRDWHQTVSTRYCPPLLHHTTMNSDEQGPPCESLILHLSIIWRGTEKKTVARSF